MEEYLGLTEEKVKEMKGDGFQPDQIAKCNRRELHRLDEKLQKYTTPFEAAPWKEKELRLVLLGKTGSGKSSLGNLLTGSAKFEESNSCESCTYTIQEESTVIDGIKVRVIDTPGFHDTKRKPKDILTEIAKVLDTFHDGIHGFLFVFNAANFRFTEDQAKIFLHFKQGLFGPSFLKCCFVVLTHGNEIVKHGSLSDYLQREKANTFGKLLVEVLQKRVIAVESSSQLKYFREKQQQQMVRFLCSINCAVYTHQEHQQHLKSTRDKVAASLQEYVSFIEDELSNTFQNMSHDEICKLTYTEEKSIIETVLQKVLKKAQEEGHAFTENEHGVLLEGIKTVFDEKKKRLTSDSFLDKLKNFVGPLLGAMGIVLAIAFVVAR